MPTNQQPVRLAVIGAGAMGNNHSRSVAADELCTLAAIVDTDTESADRASRQYNSTAYSSLEQALEAQHIDGVVVATTTASHQALCEQLIARNVPFLVEKPITDNIVTTRAIIELATTHNITMMCGFVERFNPAVQTALGLIDEPMKHMLSVRHSPFNPRATASTVYDLLIHDLDAALAFHNRNADTTSVSSSLWFPPTNPTVDEIADCILLNRGTAEIIAPADAKAGR